MPDNTTNNLKANGAPSGEPHAGMHGKHKHHGHSAHGILSPGNDADTYGYLRKAFMAGIILNIAFVCIEFTAGVILGSVALISDAGHNLSDVISLSLALLAFRLARGKATDKYTYGRKRSTIIVSLTNACILLIAIGIILYESIEKLMHPQPIPGGVVAWVAGAGIIINAFTAWLFIRHKDKDLNIKGAYLHMAADALVSVGVVVAGLIIKFTGWYRIDPVIGIIIAVVIFISTWGLLKDSIRLSLDGVPPGIDFNEITKAIATSDDRIINVHHIHIWAISTTENALTAHLTLNSMDGADSIKQNTKSLLRNYGIDHTTLEFELAGEEREYCKC